MRRKQIRMVEPPAELRTFTPGNVTPTQRDTAFRTWAAQRFAYGQANGWPGGMLVLIQQNRSVRRAMLGFPDR